MSSSRQSAASTYERSARLWLRAYPRRWRRGYGDDLVGTLQDLAAPDARWVGLRDGLSVLRAGWALRLRERPPLRFWLVYRFLDRPLPARYVFWMMDDLLGRFYVARTASLALLVVPLTYWLLSLADRGDGLAPGSLVPMVVAWLGMSVVTTLLLPRWRARHLWRKRIGPLPAELLNRKERAWVAPQGR